MLLYWFTNSSKMSIYFLVEFEVKYLNILSFMVLFQRSTTLQGSALGPATFVINGGDLHPVAEGNDLLKYADDTYLIVPAENSPSCEDELHHTTQWATANNLHLNQSKSAEIIFLPGALAALTSNRHHS